MMLQYVDGGVIELRPENPFHSQMAAFTILTNWNDGILE
jgi:hypothetical protein